MIHSNPEIRKKPYILGKILLLVSLESLLVTELRWDYITSLVELCISQCKGEMARQRLGKDPFILVAGSVVHEPT